MTFFAATLLAFYAGGIAGLREGVAFYIWIGLINVFIVSQFWQFANDLYTEGQGRRLFPLIGVGQSLGAWVGRRGGGAARPGAELHAVHADVPRRLRADGGARHDADRQRARSASAAHPEVRDAGNETLGPQGGFELILQDRYLLWIAVLIVLLNVVNTTGGYVLNRLIVAEAAARFGTGPVGGGREPAVRDRVLGLDHRDGQPGRPAAAAVRHLARASG